MIAYDRIKKRLQFLIDDDSTETAADILEMVNTAYRQICADHIWQSLFESLTVSGTTLNSDMERPTIYFQDDTDYLWHPISLTDRYMTPMLYNWYPDGVVTTPLYNSDDNASDDGIIAANGTNFNSALSTFTSNVVDEYIQIGSNEGIYKITALADANNVTLSRGYRGAAETAAHFEIRPRGTPKINYTDYEGEQVDISSVASLWYQRRPLPIYNDFDQLMLPGTCEAVRIMAFKMLLEGAKYDNDSLKKDPEFMTAIAHMQPLNPTVGRAVKPRDRTGAVVRFGRVRPTKRVNQNNRRILGV